MSSSLPPDAPDAFTATEVFDRDALRKIVSNWRDLPVSSSTRRKLDSARFERGAERRPVDLVRAYLDASSPTGRASEGLSPPIRYRRAGAGSTTGHGRQYAVGPSLQNLPRAVRHTIAGALYRDIDMVNAHAVLLVQYCARFGIAAPTVAEYAGERREAMLEQLGVPRSEGKRAIISLLNGGRRACEDLPRRPAWLSSLAHEVKRIHGVLVSEARHSAVVDAARLRVYLAPCISADAFEVGEEVAAQFDDSAVLRRPDWPRPHVDLKAALRRQLDAAGVAAAHVEDSGGCTLGDRDRFYSYRAEGGTPGRMVGFVGLRP